MAQAARMESFKDIKLVDISLRLPEAQATFEMGLALSESASLVRITD